MSVRLISVPALIPIVFTCALALPWHAVAQTADGPPQAQRAHTLRPPANNKVLSGVQHGAEATGRGIDRAGQATERGVNNVSARASRPVRDLGERIARKLGPGPSRRTGPPMVGPQGNAP